MRKYALLCLSLISCAISMVASLEDNETLAFEHKGCRGHGVPQPDRAKNLERAIDMRDTPQLLELIKAGADVNRPLTEKGDFIQAVHGEDARATLDERGGITPLIRAAYNGNSEAVVQLLKYGAEIAYQDEQGVSPLVAAALGAIEFQSTGHGEHYAIIAKLLYEKAPFPTEQQLQLLYAASLRKGNVYACSEYLDEPNDEPISNGIRICWGSAPCNRRCLDRALALLEQKAGQSLPPVAKQSVLPWWCTLL